LFPVAFMKSAPSMVKSRSNSTRLRSNSHPPKGIPSLASAARSETRYASRRPARMLTRVRPMAWSWYQRLPGGCSFGYEYDGDEK
jgi:hypothetical protein